MQNGKNLICYRGQGLLWRLILLTHLSIMFYHLQSDFNYLFNWCLNIPLCARQYSLCCAGGSCPHGIYILVHDEAQLTYNQINKVMSGKYLKEIMYYTEAGNYLKWWSYGQMLYTGNTGTEMLQVRKSQSSHLYYWIMFMKVFFKF